MEEEHLIDSFTQEFKLLSPTIEVWDGENNEASIVDRAKLALLDYCEQRKAWDWFRPQLVEQKFKVMFGSTPMQGQVDVTTPTILVDYKRKKSATKNFELLLDIQTTIYARALGYTMVAHICLEKTGRQRCVPVIERKDKRSNDHAEKLVEAVISGVKNKMFPMTIRSNPLCSPLYCPVAHHCRFPKGGNHGTALVV